MSHHRSRALIKAATAALAAASLFALTACTSDGGSGQQGGAGGSSAAAGSAQPTAATVMPEITNPDARGLAEAIAASQETAKTTGQRLKMAMVEEMASLNIGMCVDMAVKNPDADTYASSTTTSVLQSGTKNVATMCNDPKTAATVHQVIIGDKAWMNVNDTAYKSATLSAKALKEVDSSASVSEAGKAYATLFNDPAKFTKKDANTYEVRLDDPKDLGTMSGFLGSAGSDLESTLSQIDKLTGTATFTTADGTMASAVIVMAITAQDQTLDMKATATYDYTPVDAIKPPANVEPGTPTTVDSLTELGALVGAGTAS